MVAGAHPLGQIQYLYFSPLNNAFLKVCFAKKLHLAQKSPGNGTDTICVVLGSVTLGTAEHAALVFAQIMDDGAQPLLEKLHLLWCTPKVEELLVKWSLKKVFLGAPHFPWWGFAGRSGHGAGRS